MITYRHHIVSLVAVFLALGIGIALGGGPLSEIGRAEPEAKTKVSQRALDDKRAAGFADTFAAASAKALYQGRLADHPVAILAMPGADDTIVADLTTQVEAAGGVVAGRYDVQPALVEPSEKSLVDTLGSQLLTQIGSGSVDAEASTYVRMGQLLALALATTRETGQPAGDGAVAVRQSLAGAELMISPEEDATTAPLVLVILGDQGAVATSAEADLDAAILSGLLEGLSSTSNGVVVAASAESGVDGALAALRDQAVGEKIATVDGAESVLGQVTTVLALLRAFAGAGGSFGASGADGAVPLG